MSFYYMQNSYRSLTNTQQMRTNDAMLNRHNDASVKKLQLCKVIPLIGLPIPSSIRAEQNGNH